MAALCCVVLGVMADPLPDGLVIRIGNSYVETDDYRGITGDVVTSGTIFYDVENRVLKLYSVKALSSIDDQPIISISGSTEPVKIEVYGYNDFYTDGIGANCMEFSTPVIISGQTSGATLLAGSKNNRGIVLKADLTVKDGVELHVGASSYGIIGELKDSKYPKLTVDGSRVVSSGSGSGIEELSALELIDSELSGGLVWDEEDLCVKDGIVKATDVQIIRASNVMGYTYLYNPEPEFGGKLSILKDGVEQSIPFKNNTGDYIMVELKAEDNDKFAFASFSGIGATNPADYSAGYDAGFEADWTYKLKSEQPWYVMGSDYHMYKLTEHMATTTDLGEMNSINSDHYLFCTGALGTGINTITYACQPTILEQSVMNRTFDESDLSTSMGYATIVTAQSDYTFTAMTYSEMTNTVYYAAKDNSDGKYYLLEGDRDNPGTLKAIGGLETIGITSPVTCMAATNFGWLYFITEHASNASLYALWYLADKFFLGSKQFDLGYGSKGTNALGFDPYTNEMIWLQDDENYDRTIRVIDFDTHRAYKVADFTKKPTGMFQLHEVRKVTTAVENGCEEMGKVTIPYYNTYGYYAEGSKVTITATPNDYWHFVKWKEDGNTEAERTITIGNQDQTYTAVFDWNEGITTYPIWIDNKQVHSARLSFNYSNSNITSGSATYDPLTNTLTLKDVKYEDEDIECMIRAGKEDSDLKNLTIRLEGTNTFKQKNLQGCVFSFDHVDATFTGSGTLKTECLNTSSAILLLYSNLTFEGVEADIQANYYGIKGDGGENSEQVTVRGSDLKVQGGGAGSIVGIGALNINYCDMTDPTGAEFNESWHAVVVSGLPTKDQIVFAPWPQLTVEPVEPGSGKFILKSDDAEFENVGWFTAGTKVTIEAVPAEGFEFARWTHDMLWGDEDKIDDWLGETITWDKTPGSETLSALFYYSPESDATWYAVNQNKYVSFEMGERGAHVAAASGPSASDVRCGDYRDGILEYYTNDAVKTIPFGGVVDKEAMSGKDDIEKLFDITLTVYDVAYDLANDVMYAISSDFLYRVNYEDKKLDPIGQFYLNGSIVYGRCVAVDTQGTIYVLISSTPYAKLCTVVNIDEDLKKVEIEPVGQFDGSTGQAVTSFQHSIAFDHATGELFWGREDYIRKFDLETGKAYICGDLGRQRGGQGVLTAMHRMPEVYKVNVKVATECKEMGKVSVSSSEFGTGQFFVDTKATITAKAEEGYKFLYWIRSGSKKEIEEEVYSFFVSGSTSFTAYFEEIESPKPPKPDEGIEDVDASQLTGDKVIIDGELYIIVDKKMYNATGIRVK